MCPDEISAVDRLRERAKVLPQPASRTLRAVASAALFDLAFEHHEAIVILFSRGMYGSGLALGRTLTDTAVRALWLAYCAPEHDLDGILREETPNLTGTSAKPSGFPPFRTMLAALDEHFSAQDFFTGMKTFSWDSMHSYTHSGGLQVGHRVGADGHIERNYSPLRIRMRMLGFTYDLLLMVIHAFEILHGTKGDAVMSAMRTLKLLDELNAMIQKPKPQVES